MSAKRITMRKIRDILRLRLAVLVGHPPKIGSCNGHYVRVHAVALQCLAMLPLRQVSTQPMLRNMNFDVCANGQTAVV